MEAEKLAEQNNNRDERQQALADAGGARPNDKNFIPTMQARANDFFGPGGFDKVLEAVNGLAKEAHEISIGKAVEDLGPDRVPPLRRSVRRSQPGLAPLRRMQQIDEFCRSAQYQS